MVRVTIARLSLALVAALTACASPSPPGIGATPPAPGSEQATTFGYPSVEAALTALRKDPKVRIFKEHGWTIADDRANYTLWSFTPPSHPAYPAAVKRVVVQDDTGNIRVMMTELCQAQKAACDKLWKAFSALNDQVAQHVPARI